MICVSVKQLGGLKYETIYFAIRELHDIATNPIQKLCEIAGIQRSSYYKWLTDVTEMKYGLEQKAHLSAILDLGDKSIVAFVLGHSNNNNLVFKTFDIAHKEYPDATPLFHSDRGFQYTSKIFHKKLVDAGMTQSMSRVSRCIDNGPMEAFWGMLKSEMYYLKKFNSYDELEAAVSEYIDYYNNHRYQKRLSCMTPIEYRRHRGHTAA